MNFLGIGTGELIVILIIAVLVVGPDKVVELATKAGMLIAKMRKMTDSATTEFREALAIDEIKEAIQGVTDEVKDIGQEVKGTANDVAKIGADAQAAVQDVEAAAASTPVVPQQPPITPKPVSTGTIPQVILDMMGPVTQTTSAEVDTSSLTTPDSIDHSVVDEEPLVVPETTVAVDEQDEEPIELDDVVVVEAVDDSKRSMTGSAS
jgi:Tat protein translocase TatB subunit